MTADSSVPGDDGVAKKTTRRRSRGGRARKTGDGAVAPPAGAGATATKVAPRSRAAPPPAPAAADVTAAEDAVLGLLIRQTAALEEQKTLVARQTQLMQALLDAQERTQRQVERLLKESVAAGIPERFSVEIKPRMAIFVDVPNILYAAERAGVVLDWGKVADFFAAGRTLVRAIAYAPVSDDPAARRENERFVVPFMDRNYRIVTKPLKRFSGGGVKANFDVELAVDIVTMADRLDVIGLVSGAGDFRRVVEIAGSHGVRVEVMAFGQSTSADLREVADRYIDMAAYIPDLTVDG